MRSTLLIGLLLSAGLGSQAATAGPTVTMYGASWCGPCGRLRTWFDQNGVRYQYKDVDDPQVADEFAKVAGRNRAIPLTVVGGSQFRGTAFAEIAQAAGLNPSAPPKTGGDLYGGRSTQEWQRDFRELRAYVERVKEAVKKSEKNANDDVAKEQLERLRSTFKTADAALTQLDIDASKVSLPRDFRR